MNKLFKSLLCLALLVATLGATDKDKKAAAASGLPPIIDRELIFGNPEIAGRAAFARRQVSGIPEAVERHAQRLGEEAWTSHSAQPGC